MDDRGFEVKDRRSEGFEYGVYGQRKYFGGGGDSVRSRGLRRGASEVDSRSEDCGFGEVYG